MSTTAVKSIWEPLFGSRGSQLHPLRAARLTSALFAVLLIAIALVVWLSEGSGSSSQGFGILMLGLKVLSLIFPPVLGVFLVAVLTRRGSDNGCLVALAAGIATLVVIDSWPRLFGSPAPFAWTWNPLIGCALAFGIAALFPPPPTDTEHSVAAEGA